MQSDFDKDIQAYFTDVEYLRNLFKSLISAPTLTKHLLVIHGVGGVGKSSLLRMYRLHCKSVKVPVALTSGDDAKSAIDVLYRQTAAGDERGWVPDLKVDGLRFPKFDATLAHYRAIQAKVDEQSKKAQDARSRAVNIAGKAASKTAEAAGGALAGAAIGSVIPGIGTAIGGALGGVLGGMGAEALVDWLRGFLTKPDIDLLLDPSKKITSDFLEDIAKVAKKRRIVLMLDTFEQMASFDDWARDFLQRIHSNVLLVIAGRKLPNWNRIWQDWMASAQVEELKPMTEDIMCQLIRRYYATMHGGEPDPPQVDAIVRFARGLPMVVTSAVQLWVKYGVENFQSVKVEIVANLVDRLMEGVPSTLIPALEAAAVVRWFDQPILRAVTGLEDVRDVYNELRRFPFVRVRVEGLALHDAVREIMDENLRVQDFERHCELHERAAAYFEKRLEKATDEVAERMGLERLYHRVLANEEAGIKLFQEMVEELIRYRLRAKLRTLLNDVNTYRNCIAQENDCHWIEYYIARLLYLDGQWEDAEHAYQQIENNVHLEPKLRAYVLCDHGEILTSLDRRGQPGNPEKALDLTQQALRLAPLDSKLVEAHKSLATLYYHTGQWQQIEYHLGQALDFYKQHSDALGVADICFLLRWFYTLMGNWKKMFEMHYTGVESILPFLEIAPMWREGISRTSLGWIWAGRYKEYENNLKEVVDVVSPYATDLQGKSALSDVLCWLAYGVGIQGKYQEAHNLFSEAFRIRQDLFTPSKGFTSFWYGFWGAIFLKQGDLENAEKYLLDSMEMKRNNKDSAGIPELLVWLGELYHIRQEWGKAENCYMQCLELQWTSRRYFECGALVGMVRVKYANGDYAAIPVLLANAEQLAQQYEYNDHIASLRLTQGHLAWENANNSNTLPYYQQAMTYALRYNRFLLDELLGGRPQGTPLRPIIPYCLEHGEEGKKILIALRDWWKIGVNDIGTPRPDTISPIPEGIPLLEAERLAREREPGNGSPQKSVIEQIEEALHSCRAG